MKIRPVGAKLIHTKGQTSQSWQSLFEILRTPSRKTNVKLRIYLQNDLPSTYDFPLLCRTH